MKLLFFFIITTIFLTTSSCRKCYICEAKMQNMDEMIDFDKSCGSDADKKKMEDEFRAKYKTSDGYTVNCR